jgi:hypothetical protein
MDTFKYFLFAFLAIIAVLAIRGDLAYFFPALWNYVAAVHYYVESMYTQFLGYRQPVNPDPSYQHLSERNKNQSNVLFLIGAIFMTSICFYFIFRT